MLRLLIRLDAALASTRPAWLWLGQIALVALGVHLVADQLDDLVYGVLTSRTLPWPREDMPSLLAFGLALLVELAVVGRAALMLWRSGEAVRDRRVWWQRASVDAMVRPLFWLPVALAGAWAVGMAVEDVLAPWVPEVAAWCGLALGAAVALRLGLSGAWRVTAGVPMPRRRVDGLLWAPALLLVAALAVVNGLPAVGVLP